jgi:geranylgeranyl diphosphate synthase type II
VYGDGIAILAGDGLLTDAFALLAREPRPEPSAETDATLDARKLRVVRVVAHAAGSPGMVGGQAVDLQAAEARSTLDAEALDDMHRRKTGALIRASAVAGAVMGGAGDDTISAIDEYARHLGLAFQIVDDMLDVSGASSEKEDRRQGRRGGQADLPRPARPRTVPPAGRPLPDRRSGRPRGRGALGQRLAELADWVVNRTS